LLRHFTAASEGKRVQESKGKSSTFEKCPNQIEQKHSEANSDKDEISAQRGFEIELIAGMHYRSLWGMGVGLSLPVEAAPDVLRWLTREPRV